MDIEALLDTPTSSPEALSRLTLERRLHLSGKAASSFEEEIIEREEAARLALQKADYRTTAYRALNRSINQAEAPEAL